MQMRELVKKVQDFLFRNSLAQSLARERYRRDLLADARYQNPARLTSHEHQVFSQNGEDGAIREIFHRVGVQSRFFVEIGVGNGLENNTTFLLMQGWSGLWIEGSKRNCAAIRKTFSQELASGQLTLLQTLVTAENINTLLRPWTTCPIDLFSLDVDLNTAHIWAALNAIHPRVSVIEYNATFPSDVPWIADYDPTAWWDGSSYFGASLFSLNAIAERRNESLVGCDLSGTNAYFVQSMLCGSNFLDPGNTCTHYEPPRAFLGGRKPGHPRAIKSGP